ncbi:hypothetical protein LIER_30859 [Lithospermum erythrorhizon]|uniref:Uncharacterized protein n=1 Tax=Lithospermum erythrorhizon TaxID=34254 RepID=A0AAV3RUC4_LITER
MTSVQGKAEITSADKVFDNMPQPENSTNSTNFAAGNCGSKMERQIRPSKEWQPVGKHVPNARSAMGNTVAPKSSAQIPLMQNTCNEVKNLVLENSFKELASSDQVQSIKDAAGNLEYKEGSGSGLITVLEQNAHAVQAGSSLNLQPTIDQLTRKSPVAAKNAKKQVETTEKMSALPPVNTPTSRARLVEKEGTKLVQTADSLEEIWNSTKMVPIDWLKLVSFLRRQRSLQWVVVVAWLGRSGAIL